MNNQICAALLIFLFPVLAAGQTTGGVFGPVVNAGHRSMQYRAAFDPDSNRLAQRIHYQQALNDDFMLRGLIQTRETADSTFHYEFFQAELFWDLYEGKGGYRNGFRFDARIRGEGRPGALGINFINHWSLARGYSARLLVLSSIDVGDGRRDGVGISTRANFTRHLHSGMNVGLEMFSSYGTTDDFADFNDQSHQIGPVISRQLKSGWSLLGSLLFGLTDGAANRNLRIWIGKSFTG